MRNLLIALLLLNPVILSGSELWEQGFAMPVQGMPNPYQLQDADLAAYIKKGKIHALRWPVEITGALLPYYPTRCFLNVKCHLAAIELAMPIETLSANSIEAMNRRLNAQFGLISAGSLSDDEWRFGHSSYTPADGKYLSFDRWTEWLGLYDYPPAEGSGVFYVPYPEGKLPDYRMGVSVINKYGTKALTFSCAACHAEKIFGRQVIGLTTRFSRANTLFHHGSRGMKFVIPSLFALITGASDEEVRIIKDLKKSMRQVDSKVPQALGLDTSLAQVGLSLQRRGSRSLPGPARSGLTQIMVRGKNPDFPVADSKPAVWWNVKFKNRWLSDGSLVSGNPILTNFLWNEIGRGTELVALEEWLAENEQTVKEMTAMVYASQAPHITDFFDAKMIDIRSAKRGEKLFGKYCERCHGKYVKNWSLEGAPEMTAADRLKTFRVEYFENTGVKNVGTDSARYKGMNRLLALNDLDISKKYGARIVPTEGYVPPPLVGIWARWPYFHNNSVPTLCDVVEPVSDRPKVYHARPARDKNVDFDFECNGYPKRRNKYPKVVTGLLDPMRYDTSRLGMSNRGHDKGITVVDGEYVLSADDKRDLIRFLQTL
jgi:hypothetical protein